MSKNRHTKKLLISVLLSLFINLYSSDYRKQAADLEKSENFSGALDLYKKASEVLPNDAELHIKIAELAYKTDELLVSLCHLENALLLRPNMPLCLIYKALVLRDLGELEQAGEIFEKIYNFKPVVTAADHPLWAHYMRCENFKKIAQLWPYAKSPWIDTNVANKIIVWRIPEKSWGAGDVFMRIRFARQLHEHGAHVIAVCKPALVPILSQCPFLEQVKPVGDPIRLHDLEYTCGREEDSLFAEHYCKNPETSSYMFADPTLIKEWKKHLAHDNTFKIGVCWQSEPFLKNKKIIQGPRSFDLALLAPLAALPNVTLYSLQKSFGTQQLAEISFNVRWIRDFDTAHGAFMDTAAIMCNLDLVITVDTSIAHLAGALGIPVWVMLGKNSDFRWFKNRSDSPWYPSMRLFRQTEHGNWKTVIEELVNELKKDILKNKKLAEAA